MITDIFDKRGQETLKVQIPEYYSGIGTGRNGPTDPNRLENMTAQIQARYADKEHQSAYQKHIK